MLEKNFGVLKSQFTLGAGASANIAVCLTDAPNLQFLYSVTYATTSSVTGVAVRLKSGFGPTPDPGQVVGPLFNVFTNGSLTPGTTQTFYSSNYFEVAMAPMLPSQGGSQTVNTSFYLNTLNTAFANHLLMEIANSDQSRSCTITIYQCISGSP